MYKTKLQELCHKTQWGFPKYSAMKDGPDHSPCFKASVSVNGLSFHSSVSCKSSKEAHNDAAMLAFLHLTSPPPSSLMVASEIHAEGPKTSAISEKLDSHSDIPGLKNGSEPNNGQPNVKEAYQEPDIQSHALCVEDDAQRRYKSRLQNYACTKKCDLPSYSSVSMGPSHAPCFQATVTVDGQTFESAEFFMTLKEAEQAAAKVALMSLQTDGFPEDELGFYKNLLQELAQREDFSIPVYKTIKSDPPHMLTFASSVEVEGEIFYGKTGKSKKEAQMKAAKVAYTVLKERAMSRSAELASKLLKDETLKSTSGSDSIIAVDLLRRQNPKHNGQLLSSLAITQEERLAESKVHEIVSTNAKVASEDCIASATLSHMDKEISSPCSESFPTSSKEGPFSSTLMRHGKSLLTVSDTDVVKAKEPKSYLLCNRFRVYTCYPDIAFPKGITVLPISENRWVAVSLELPNEQDC